MTTLRAVVRLGGEGDSKKVGHDPILACGAHED